MLFEYKKGFFIKAKNKSKAEKKLKERNISYDFLKPACDKQCKIKKKIKKKKIELKAFQFFLKEVVELYGKNDYYYVCKNKNKETKRELKKLKKRLIY